MQRKKIYAMEKSLKQRFLKTMFLMQRKKIYVMVKSNLKKQVRISKSMPSFILCILCMKSIG
jgi:hypothetical protein